MKKTFYEKSLFPEKSLKSPSKIPAMIRLANCARNSCHGLVNRAFIWVLSRLISELSSHLVKYQHFIDQIVRLLGNPPGYSRAIVPFGKISVF
jgi:hypothetical protein